MKPSPPKVLLSAGMIQGGLSGVGRYVVEIARRLGPEPTLSLHVAGLDADRTLFPTVPDERWISLPPRFGKGAANLLWHFGPLRGILRRGGFDLYHSPSYRRIMPACPVPQIATIHDCAPFHLRDKYGAARGFFGRILVPVLARRCRHVLTVSHFTAGDIERFFKIPASRLTVIHNGLDHSRYRPLSEEDLGAFRERVGVSAPYLLYLSRLEHPGKNHVRLIEAYDRARAAGTLDSPLVLGGAPWHGAEAIYKRSAASPYSADIALPGFIDEADLPYWYGAARALVFPSLIEGFGLPVAEAMACGTPVLSSDRGSLPEVGGDAALYFDPTSVEEMAAALLTFAGRTPAEAQAFREKGFTQAGRFHWDLAAQATGAAYLRSVSPSTV
ncbi:MAG: glycosyltransferase family 4 protein [Opitutales bacterium]|nr:glycosyltransferase family 4 protein [Opitutales bacterium]